MVAAIDRKTALERTFAAAFSALDDFRGKSPAEAFELATFIAAHLRSSMPQALLSLDTGPVPMLEVTPPELVDARRELERLTAETEHMRPVYVAALEWATSEPIGGQLNHAKLLAIVEPLVTETPCDRGCQCAECRINAAATP
jgi:hypothetical protein